MFHLPIFTVEINNETSVEHNTTALVDKVRIRNLQITITTPAFITIKT